MQNVRNRLKLPEKKEQNLQNVRSRLKLSEKKERNLQCVRNRLKNPVNNERKRILCQRRRENQQYFIHDKIVAKYRLQAKNKAINEKRRILYQRKKNSSDYKMLMACRKNTKIYKNWKKLINDFCLQFHCTCCLQTRYRSDVVIVSDSLRVSLNATESLRKCVSGHLSVNNQEWICKTCYKFLKKDKIPPQSVANGFDYREIDSALSGLTFAEEKLVALRIAFIIILERPRGGQYACRGTLINVPSDFPKTILEISRQLLKHEVIGVSIHRRMSDKQAHFKQYINPKKVIQAAKVFIKTPLYKNTV